MCGTVIIAWCLFNQQYIFAFQGLNVVSFFSFKIPVNSGDRFCADFTHLKQACFTHARRRCNREPEITGTRVLASDWSLENNLLFVEINIKLAECDPQSLIFLRGHGTINIYNDNNYIL